MAAATIIHLSMRVAYKLIRLHNRFIKSSTKGAAVAVWYNGQILVVRHSYMPGWSLPGGGGKKNEEPRVTASREISEEVGIDLALDELVLVRKSHSGHSLFEYQLSSPSEPQIDNREIIEAKFLNPTLVSDPDCLLYSYLKRVTGDAQG
jgi:ADP-ribose pyrophosphatase YjhB (NUDIX family)